MFTYRRTVVLVALALAIAACRGEKKTAQVDSTGVALTWNSDSSLVGPPTQNPVATRAYIRNIVKWEAHDSSAYEGNFVCEGCGRDSVKLRIVPSKRALNVDWATALVNRSRKGWIVAKITNKSDVAFLPLDLKPDSTAYLWVGPIDDAGNEHGVAFYKVDLVSGDVTRSPAPVITTVEFCDMPNSDSRKASSAHKNHPASATNCGPKNFGEPHALVKTARLASRTMFARGFPSDGLWLSCVGGCCKIMAD